MLRLLKLKPFRKLKVVQRLLERRQARKLRNESAAEFAAVEDEQQVAEQCRSSKSRPPAPRKVSGDDGASASCPAESSRQRDRDSNEPEPKKHGWRVPLDAPVDASASAEAAVTDAAVDASVCSRRPYHVRTQANGSSALEHWSPPPPLNPYDSDNGYDASPRAHRLRPDCGSNAAAEAPTPSLPHTSHLLERNDAAASRDGSNVPGSAGLQADTSAAVARADRDDSSNHREIAQQRRSSNRAQSGSDGRRHRSNVVDDQSAATPDCDHTDDAHKRPCPTPSAIVTAAAASNLSTGATATDTDSAVPASSPPPSRSRLRRRHSMPARDRATGSSDGSTLQRLHRLRRSFVGGLRASKYSKLRSGDSQSVLGHEASTDANREPFSKTLRRSFRESFRYGIQSLSAAGIGSGIGMAMAPTFAMPMPFGGLTTVV